MSRQRNQVRWTCRMCGSDRLFGAYCCNCAHRRDYDQLSLVTWEEFLGVAIERFSGEDWACCAETYTDAASFCRTCGCGRDAVQAHDHRPILLRTPSRRTRSHASAGQAPVVVRAHRLASHPPQ